MKRVVAGCAALLAVASISISGQSLPWRGATDLPQFEVASIRRNSSAETPRWTSRFTPGGYQATNIRTRDLIKVAYGLILDDQIGRAPTWIDDDRFDIQSSAPGADAARMRLMLQRLLIERFKLAARSDKTEVLVFVLTMARDDKRLGTRLKPMGDVCPDPASVPAGGEAGVDQLPCGQYVPGGGAFLARGITMARFAELLTANRTSLGLDRLIVDRSSLGGLYTIDVRFTPPELPGLRKPETQDTLPEFPTAIREQLGLRLEPERAPIDAIVIERIERPEPN